MRSFDALELRAGPVALARLRERGLRPTDIACVPAAAGGPKGLGPISWTTVCSIATVAG